MSSQQSANTHCCDHLIDKFKRGMTEVVVAKDNKTMKTSVEYQIEKLSMMPQNPSVEKRISQLRKQSI